MLDTSHDDKASISLHERNLGGIFVRNAAAGTLPMSGVMRRVAVASDKGGVIEAKARILRYAVVISAASRPLLVG